MTRNEEHKLIMTVIYDELVDSLYGENKISRDAFDLASLLAEVEDKQEVSEFVKKSIYESLNNYGKAVNTFTPFLTNWKWERLPTLTQAILIKSYAHFYFVEKVDKHVVINVAIELAKTYVDPAQAKFINAILDKVLN